jgi:hypothetical protein
MLTLQNSTAPPLCAAVLSIMKFVTAVMDVGYSERLKALKTGEIYDIRADEKIKDKEICSLNYNIDDLRPLYLSIS